MGLAGREVFPLGLRARWPDDRHPVGLRGSAEPEGQGVLDGGQIALAQEELATHDEPPGLDLDPGPDRVAVGAGTPEVEPEGMVPVAAVVPEEVGGAAV